MAFSVYQWCFVAMLMANCQRGVSAQSQRELVKCYQCNVFSKGKQNFCELSPEELIVENCIACHKTFTFTSIHDRWYHPDSLTHRFRRGMSYFSKYCLTEDDANLLRKDGCYKIESANGFSEQCFCQSDLCNGSSTVKPRVLATLFVSLGLLWKVLSAWV